MASLYEMLDGTGRHLASGLASINTLNNISPDASQAKARLHLVEEMSELTQEIIKKDVRNQDRIEEFHEELADVILLLDQCVRCADAEWLFSKMEYKINRFKERHQDGRQ